MKSYSVKEISDMLHISPETVRRWIRSGKLTAVQESRKEGNTVTEAELKKFLKSTPKYASIAATGMMAALPAVGLPLAACGLISSVVLNQVDSMQKLKEAQISSESIISYLEKTISDHEKIIKEKKGSIEQLTREIEAEKRQISMWNRLIVQLKTYGED